MRLLSFAGIEFTGLNSSYSMGVVAESAEMRIAGGNGAYDLLGDGARFPNQDYAAEFVHRSDDCDEITSRLIDRLRGAMQRRGELVAEFDQSRRVASARLVNLGSEPTFNDIRAGINRVKCVFRADPFWHDDALSVAEFANAATVLAVNSGNAATARLKFTITSAIASSLIITNTTNGETLTYGAAKANGIALAIDCETGSVTLNGANAYVAVTLPNTQIHLMTLAAGENFFSFNTPITGSVEYRGCFV